MLDGFILILHQIKENFSLGEEQICVVATIARAYRTPDLGDFLLVIVCSRVKRWNLIIFLLSHVEGAGSHWQHLQTLELLPRKEYSELQVKLTVEPQ